MSYVNLIGLIIMILIMIPNIIYAVKYKGQLRKLPQTKIWKIFEVFEQIGRYGCFICMIFKIPGVWVGFFFYEFIFSLSWCRFYPCFCVFDYLDFLV